MLLSDGSVGSIGSRIGGLASGASRPSNLGRREIVRVPAQEAIVKLGGDKGLFLIRVHPCQSVATRFFCFGLSTSDLGLLLPAPPAREKVYRYAFPSAYGLEPRAYGLICSFASDFRLFFPPPASPFLRLLPTLAFRECPCIIVAAKTTVFTGPWD